MKLSSTFLLWPLLFLGQLLGLSLLAWHLLSLVSFGYPLGYRLLDLRSHIAQYAPQNRYKVGFEYTSRQEHLRLFSEITSAIQNNGKGLRDIRYSLPSGELAPLMNADEINHLEDVGHIVRGFYSLGYLGALLWVATLIFACCVGLKFPPLNRILFGAGGAALLMLAALFAIGPIRFFYWCHTKLFPASHKWFFYYQDSLMTTMMKAPDIFAFIGVELFLLLLLLLVVSNFFMAHGLARSAALSCQSRDQRFPRWRRSSRIRRGPHR